MNYKPSAKAQKQIEEQAASLQTVLKKAVKLERDFANALLHQERTKQELQKFTEEFDPNNTEKLDAIIRLKQTEKLFPEYIEECKPKLGDVAVELHEASQDLANAMIRLANEEREAVHAHMLGLLKPFLFPDDERANAEVTGVLRRVGVFFQIPSDRAKLGVSYSEPQASLESLRAMIKEAQTVQGRLDQLKADGWRFAPVPDWQKRVGKAAA